MEFFMAVILGWVQGITEFLPISSTGHLILVRQLFGESVSGNDLAFDAVVHLATTAALLLYFAKDIMLLFNVALRMLGRLPVDDRDRTLVFALAIGAIPGGVTGLLLQDFIDTRLRQPLIVAAMLIVGSLVFAYAEYVFAYGNRQAPLSIKSGFKIGLYQCLAMIPGVSRSGITISAGLFTGLTRHEAVRFAFLVGIPVVLGAGVKKLIDLLKVSGGDINWVYLTTGAITAFFVGLVAIHFMMNFVRRYTLWPFIWYRILLAIFVIALVYFGG